MRDGILPGKDERHLDRQYGRQPRRGIAWLHEFSSSGTYLEYMENHGG